jgi:hypothetical protein
MENSEFKKEVIQARQRLFELIDLNQDIAPKSWASALLNVYSIMCLDAGMPHSLYKESFMEVADYYKGAFDARQAK